MYRLTKAERDSIIGNLLVLLDHLPQQKLVALEKYLSESKTRTITELKVAMEISGLSYSALGAFVKNVVAGREYLLLALETGLATKNHIMETIDLCELIWTAPAVQFRVPARSTMMVMKEMITSATKRVTIVGYRVEEYARPLITCLHDALTSDVQITLVLDRAEDHLFLFKKTWKKENLPPVYTRKTNVKDPMEALHAKLIICDYTDLLVTSANLTYHGLSANLEIGVKIHGKTANNAQLLINSLIRNGDLVLVT